MSLLKKNKTIINTHGCNSLVVHGKDFVETDRTHFANFFIFRD